MGGDRPTSATEPAGRPARGRPAGDLGHRAHAALGWTLARLPDRVRALHHHLQSLEPMERPPHLGAHPPCADRRRPHRRGGPARQHLREGSLLSRWGKRGAKAQAIGISRGGRTTKIHAVCDLLGRPLALALTPGNTSDIKVASALIAAAGRLKRLIADRGYDANNLRRELKAAGHQADHSRPAQPRAADPARPHSLCRALAHRGHVLPPEGLSPRRHPIRQAHHQLPRQRSARRHHQLLVLNESGP